MRSEPSSTAGAHPVPVLGLTGAVGAGKSTVAALAAAEGCAVLDVDRMGRDALGDGAVAAAVAAALGAGVLDAAGNVDRARVASVVFADEAARRRVEAIVHPHVRRTLDAALATARGAARTSPLRAIVVDCALLFEGGLERLCDVTVVVEAPDAVREARLARDRGWDAGESARRAAAQLSPAEKRARADRVLANDGDREALRLRTRELLDELAPTRRDAARPAAGRIEG